VNILDGGVSVVLVLVIYYEVKVM